VVAEKTVGLDELEGKIAVTKELQKHPWACRDLDECGQGIFAEKRTVCEKP
jgi:hypothetical protein